MSGQLAGRVTLVTGSTRGIGRAMAQRFAAEGATVVVHGRRPEDAEEVAAAIPRAVAVAADLHDRAAAASLVDRVVRRVGRIDVLVNNAAVMAAGSISRVGDEAWDTALGVNLTAPMAITRAAVPGMKTAGGGVILNVVSSSGTDGISGFSAYGASKAGLLGLTLTWARELHRFGIRVNALSPEAVTDMVRAIPPEEFAIRTARMPTPEAIADVALFLVGDASRAVWGQCLVAAGPPPD
ncbi:MAG: fabG [Arthrobacter sp.]|nr:fabG [Arthrobacter sp.]